MDRLNERERQVVSYAASGESNKAIGYRLGLATSTIATHLGSLYRKLGVKNRAQLVEGASNARIAELRKTSIRTVANQLASLLAKLGVRSRAELAARFAGAAPPRD